MSSAETIAKPWRLSRKAARQRRSRRLLAARVVQATIAMAACLGSAQWPRNQQGNTRVKHLVVVVVVVVSNDT